MGVRGRVLTLLGLMWFCGTGPAAAYTITIGLTAEVTGVGDLAGFLGGQINVGDAITGAYSYESTTLDTSPFTTIGQYPHYEAPYGVVLYGGPFVFQTDPDNVDFGIGILDNDQGRDSYAFGSRSNLPLSNGVEVLHIGWQLDDYSRTALSSDALPLTPPDLMAWEYDRLVIRLGDRGSSAIDARVTEVIPEPATIFLLALGSVALLRKERPR